MLNNVFKCMSSFSVCFEQSFKLKRKVTFLDHKLQLDKTKNLKCFRESIVDRYLFDLATKKVSCLFKQATMGPMALSPFLRIKCHAQGHYNRC